ncbi:Thioredoxin-like [Sphingobacterium nematocida]|uniref:Thioredoxin-like n=1 Tax=Sphingobacterium nematocida TaxID=1513896 RepID=A0A1T5AUJ3_9SPHI|nr:TlpA disulfide reductase family protein [Sphingobacterium nematocida]SKB38440.1 Thioredoxin-like [Sphingobacterium nematocida]
MRKYIFTSLLLLGIAFSPLWAQHVPLDSTAVVAEKVRFRNESDYQTKLDIYHRLLKEPVFLKGKYAELTIAGMQRDFVVYFAQQGKVAEFQGWVSKMRAPTMRRIAIASAYEILAKKTSSSNFVAMVRPQLDSLLLLQRWGNDEINLYSELVALYVRATKVMENPVLWIRYIEPWYKAQGNYFPQDLTCKFNESSEGIKGSLSYQFALALSCVDEPHKAFDVLAKATEIGVFSVTDIGSFEEDLPNIVRLQGRVEEHLASSRSDYAAKVKELLQKNTIDGKPYDLSKMHAKYILLDFWGSWCLPCRASHPKLVEMYAKYKDKGLEIISVSQEAPAAMDVMREKWKKAVTQDKMTWIQLLNNEGVESFDAVKEFTIAIFPTKILLDKNLNKIEVYQGGASAAQLESKIAELLEAN